ncbi:unnamed protein product [Adineta ricciae]|uniref:Uncharacterized protein n=1 Tax=Adineta ricciae TaxID=249248 RepID=A0A815LBV9_ADIRI|nr:unnamed protein product [Adineta ricciae]
MSTKNLSLANKIDEKFVPPMKQVIPSEMEKLNDLTKWPITLDVVGVFFGLSFHPDVTINDHRQFTIPSHMNRLIALIIVDKDIGKCVEELRRVCAQLHPDLFDAVFSKTGVNESGRDKLDHLFVLTQTLDEFRQTDYYQFSAKTRSEVSLVCVWINDLIEIPEK